MTDVGQIERKTQDRIVRLSQDELNYEYLGNLQDRSGNTNVEEEYLRPYLKDQGYSQVKIDKAYFELNKAAVIQTEDLYDSNKAVYNLLRYGVTVRERQGEHKETIELIDWENIENNHFAIAEEVTVEGKNTKRTDVVLYINGIAVGVIDLSGQKYLLQRVFARTWTISHRILSSPS